MKTITFIRHGKSEANKKAVMSGHSQTNLSDEGRKELEQLKDEIHYPETDLIFSSDLPRAYDTAEFLYPNQEIIKLKELRETNFGSYEGRPVDEVIEEFYELFLNNSAQDEMETYETLKQRLSSIIESISKKMSEEQKKSAVIVAHNGVLRMVHHIYKQTPFDRYRDHYTKNGRGFSIIFDAYGQVLEIVDL